MKNLLYTFVIPAKAGIQSFRFWIPGQARNDTIEGLRFFAALRMTGWL